MGSARTPSQPQRTRDTRGQSELHQAGVETWPIGVGMVSLGVTFGFLVVQSGLAWWWTPLISGLVYAGSVEFLLVGLLVAATPLASIALTTFLVNFRHVFYSVSFPVHRVRGKFAKTYAMFALIDEAYALLATRSADSLSGKRIIATQAFLHFYWVAGGIAGALFGRWIPNIEGLDFILTALFTVLAIEACRTARDAPAIILAAASALLALFVAPDELLVVAMSLYLVALLARYRLPRSRRAVANA